LDLLIPGKQLLAADQRGWGEGKPSAAIEYKKKPKSQTKNLRKKADNPKKSTGERKGKDFCGERECERTKELS